MKFSPKFFLWWSCRGGEEVIAAGGEVRVLNFEDGCSTSEIINAIKGGKG